MRFILEVLWYVFQLKCSCILSQQPWFWISYPALKWRHNGRDSVSNHQPHDCLLNRLFRRRSKKTSKLRVTGLGVGNSPGTGEFSAQRASNAENVSILWRHHVDYFCIITRGARWSNLKLWYLSMFHECAHYLIKLVSFNSLRPSDEYMSQYTRPILDQIMACGLIGTKPLSEPVLAYCQLNPWEQITIKI